jgi:hypothetical protein
MLGLNIVFKPNLRQVYILDKLTWIDLFFLFYKMKK